MCNGSTNQPQVPAPIAKMLDTYFYRSHNAPGKNKYGREYSKDFKTTTQIQDDLTEMLELDEKTVFNYMASHFNTINDKGKMKWEIYTEF